MIPTMASMIITVVVRTSKAEMTSPSHNQMIARTLVFLGTPSLVLQWRR